MNDALIGYTGFVGSTLARARDFQACFNSKNIGEIDGRSFDTVVCAGVSAVKWMANKEPEADLRAIRGLMDHLATVQAAHFILISTIDVYRDPVGVTEDDIPPTDGLHPYGLHRLMLERSVAERFPHATIIRLPGLFGPGLRKNLIFDLLQANQTDRISPAGVLQWYPMRRFPADLARIAAASVPLINVAVEPVPTRVICERFFPGITIGGPDLPAPCYDMRTNYPEALGSSGVYHLRSETVMEELSRFVAAERDRQ
jgi:hypothetical protein